MKLVLNFNTAEDLNGDWQIIIIIIIIIII